MIRETETKYGLLGRGGADNETTSWKVGGVGRVDVPARTSHATIPLALCAVGGAAETGFVRERDTWNE